MADLWREAVIRVVETFVGFGSDFPVPHRSLKPPVFSAPRQVHHAQHRRKYCKSSEWGKAVALYRLEPPTSFSKHRRLTIARSSRRVAGTGVISLLCPSVWRVCRWPESDFGRDRRGYAPSTLKMVGDGRRAPPVADTLPVINSLRSLHPRPAFDRYGDGLDLRSQILRSQFLMSGVRGELNSIYLEEALDNRSLDGETSGPPLLPG